MGGPNVFAFISLDAIAEMYRALVQFFEEALVVDSVDVFIALVLDSAMDVVCFPLRYGRSLRVAKSSPGLNLGLRFDLPLPVFS